LNDSSPIRVVLADDHTIFRSGLKALLAMEKDIQVVGEAGDATQALECCAELMPDVLVLDLVMPGQSGLQVLPRIVERCPQCRVVVLTMLPEEQYLLQVLRAGASGYVPKTAADSELIDAIRSVWQGRVYLRPRDVQMLLSEYMREGENAHPSDSLEQLSGREREVLSLTARGLSSREIGDRLFISPKTVDTYRQRLMEKLGLERRSELIAFAMARGLLQQ
jgi:two-component system, NarL family, response regulator NreC